MNIVVVVLSYNAAKRIRPCLDSLLSQSYEHQYSVLVVDNASTDGTADIVAQEYSQVSLIRNKKNYGFAGGNNIGMHEAFRNNYDSIVLINDDTKVRDNWLKELVLVANSSESIGLVQSKLLFADEAYRVNTVGNPLHFLGFSWSGGYKHLSSEFQSNKSIPIASGASVLIKRSVIEKIGYLDEKLFMYSEDVDYSWRARLAGFDIWLAADSVVFHDHKFSIGGKKFYYSERNRLVVLLSNYKPLTLLLVLPALLATEFMMLIYAFVSGWGMWKLKSWLGVLTMTFHILKKRIQVKELRKLGDKNILNIQTAKLDFEDVNNPLIRYIYNPISWIYFRVLKFIVKW